MDTFKLQTCRKNCNEGAMLILEVLGLMAQSFHRSSRRLPSVLKTSKLCTSRVGGSRSSYSGQAAHWAALLSCLPGLAGPRMLGTCEHLVGNPVTQGLIKKIHCLGMLVQAKGGDKSCWECVWGGGSFIVHSRH